jgi:hypothetical protein
MSQFCTLDEAFPVVAQQPGKKKKPRIVPAAPTTEGFTDPDRPAGPIPPANDILRGADADGVGRLESGAAAALKDFFPLPGETAGTEEWQKAFMLEPSQIPAPQPPQFRRDGSVGVIGQPTLWRQIAAPEPTAVPAKSSLAPIPSDISARLDQLTRQLDSLMAPTPIQSTAELFLFVAIGLLLLLAVDTLLRFATAMASRVQTGGGRVRLGRHWRL